MCRAPSEATTFQPSLSDPGVADRDDAAAEATAGHAGAEHSRCLDQSGDRGVHGGRGCLEVGSQALVALCHEGAGAGIVATLERRREVTDPLVLGDHVERPPPWNVAECRCVRVDVIDGGRPEWTEHLLGSAAFGDAVGVRRAEQRAMGDEKDDHVDVGRYRYLGHDQGVAVDHRGVTRLCRGDAELVHDARRDACGGVLGASGGECEFRGCPVEPEREPDGALECSARRESGTCWNVARDLPDEASGGADLGRHGRDIGSPLGVQGRRVAGERHDDVDVAVLSVGVQRDPVAARGVVDRGPAVDGHREHEPAGVVGVVTDEVHPSGSVNSVVEQSFGHAVTVVGARVDAPENDSATLVPMPRAVLPTGIELEYVTTGDPADPPLLVVNGYTSQLISWQQGYIDQLVAQGLFVIQFDNRDVGLSSKLDGQRVSPGAVLTASLQG